MELFKLYCSVGLHMQYSLYLCSIHLGHYVFFSVLDERAHYIYAAHYQKNMYFFLPSARIRLLPISEKKQSILGDKKTFRKKTSSFREIKNIFRAMFFFLRPY